MDNSHTYTDEMSVVLSQIADRIKAFLDGLLQRVNASESMQQLVSRTQKEHFYLMKQTLDGFTTDAASADKLKSLVLNMQELKSFVHTLSDMHEAFIDELQLAKQEIKLS